MPAYTYTVIGSGKASASTTVSGSFTGPTTANLVVQRYVFAGTVMFPAGLTGSQGTAGIALRRARPTASRRTALMSEP